MKYIFAIDETGRFIMSEKDKSFVCGVLISKDELSIKQKYQQTFIECDYGETAPNDLQHLIGDKNKTFHFAEISKSNEKRNICHKNLLHLVDKIFVSKDQPTLYANNQNWWLIAVTVVISEFLKTTTFAKDDEIQVLIDPRKDIVWGLPNPCAEQDISLEDANKIKENNPSFVEYHKKIKQQIENFIHIKDYPNKISINFKSDTYSLFVNLADIVCGLVRTEKNNINKEIVECHCGKFMSGEDPIIFVDKNPLMALTLIFQEISNNQFQHISLVKDLLSKVKKDANNYLYVWDMFYDLIKTKIEDRRINSNLVKLKCFVDIFICEIKKDMLAKNITQNKNLDLVILLIEYYSHIGEMQSPFKKEEILQLISQETETRLFRRWEKYVSYSLRESQIDFNAYNFKEVSKTFEDLWKEQEKIMGTIPSFISGDCPKDEPTTAIIGTLAQTYAYNDNMEQAIENFELSKNYVIKTSQVTASYLFTIYHRMKNIKKARECFKEQTSKAPEEYAYEKNYQDNWQLLSYCKLRALELYVNHSTELPSIDLQQMGSYNSEYPFPLIQKWEAIALWLENKETNKTIVEKYFTDAIKSLINTNNGFAIKTLCLPIIQCFALVNNQNPFHSKYNTILLELKKSLSHFEAYVNDKSPILNTIKNNFDIWQRAMALPFIYA
jgi:hypothetical protein